MQHNNLALEYFNLYHYTKGEFSALIVSTTCFADVVAEDLSEAIPYSKCTSLYKDDCRQSFDEYISEYLSNNRNIGYVFIMLGSSKNNFDLSSKFAKYFSNHESNLVVIGLAVHEICDVEDIYKMYDERIAEIAPNFSGIVYANETYSEDIVDLHTDLLHSVIAILSYDVYHSASLISNNNVYYFESALLPVTDDYTFVDYALEVHISNAKKILCSIRFPSPSYLYTTPKLFENIAAYMDDLRTRKSDDTDTYFFIHNDTYAPFNRIKVNLLVSKRRVNE